MHITIKCLPIHVDHVRSSHSCMVFSGKGTDGSTHLFDLLYIFLLLFDSKVFYANALMMIDIIKETFQKMSLLSHILLNSCQEWEQRRLKTQEQT